MTSQIPMLHIAGKSRPFFGKGNFTGTIQTSISAQKDKI
jgi:hypothetical protein